MAIMWSVSFLINSNKNFKDAFKFCLLKNLMFTNSQTLIKQFEKVNIKEYLIFPDLQSFIDSEINIFLTNSILSLMVESYFYNAKNKLITTNQIIKQLDEDIKLSKKLLNFKREKEIEDIIMFFRKNKKSSWGTSNEQNGINIEINSITISLGFKKCYMHFNIEESDNWKMINSKSLAEVTKKLF